MPRLVDVDAANITVDTRHPACDPDLMVSDDTAARLAILDLLARFALASDRGTIEQYAACLTDDATIWVDDQPARHGRAAAADAHRAARATGQQGPGSAAVHHVGLPTITIEGDDATSQAPWTFVSHQPPVVRAGWYHDRLRWTPSGWLIAERHIRSQTAPAAG